MLYQPIAELQVPIDLGGQRLIMIFNGNSMCAYEEATGKFFLDTVSSLLLAIYPKGPENAPVSNPLSVLKKVSMTDLRALLWASLHTYDKNDEPTWPMTLNEVGRHLNVSNILPIFNAFLKGQTSNSPTKAELGESQTDVQASPKDNPSIKQEHGGERGIELPADAFASVSVK